MKTLRCCFRQTTELVLKNHTSICLIFYCEKCKHMGVPFMNGGFDRSYMHSLDNVREAGIQFDISLGIDYN